MNQDFIFILQVIRIVKQIPSINFSELRLHPLFNIILVACPYICDNLAVIQADQEAVLRIYFIPCDLGHSLIEWRESCHFKVEFFTCLVLVTFFTVNESHLTILADDNECLSVEFHDVLNWTGAGVQGL